MFLTLFSTPFRSLNLYNLLLLLCFLLFAAGYFSPSLSTHIVLMSLFGMPYNRHCHLSLFLNNLYHKILAVFQVSNVLCFLLWGSCRYSSLYMAHFSHPLFFLPENSCSNFHFYLLNKNQSPSLGFRKCISYNYGIERYGFLLKSIGTILSLICVR